ncbi:PAN domain protein [Dictyocaulus viviparus]|uniref:PAN domain protein n=1 Tax=Dictyocaulus viviparus TaxID=29172 RepID=A0A0D8XYW9_DICVI|nr:PAN domain protein [Dictyocaulus viviparus]
MGDGCASVVYHKLQSTCQLYGHNGHFNGSKIVPANAHDFYKRTSWTGFCQDKVFPRRFYKQPPLQYAISPISHQPVINISRLKNFVELRKHVDTVTQDRSTTTVKTPFFVPDEIDEYSSDEGPNTVTFLNPTQSSEHQRAGFVIHEAVKTVPCPILLNDASIRNVLLDCSKREKLSYFVVFGHRLSSQNWAAQLQGIDQSSCVMYCSQNINAKGENAPCFSVNYEPAEEKCYLYGKNAKSNRHTAHLAVDNSFIFADKFCVETKKDCSAEAPYIVYLFKQIHKNIIASYPKMNSIVACIAACIDNENCKAVTYKIGLCILHSSSPASDPSLIADGSKQTVVIENGCQLTAETLPSLLSSDLELLNETQWEEWSPCQFGTGGQKMRARLRKCSKCEDLQIEPC